nr:amidohydrolase family protein [uncultured Rhodopila sp.]
MDLIIRNARLLGAPEHAPVDIGVRAGQIIAIETNLMANAPVFDAGGHLTCAGLVETRIHLDTSRTIDRCPPPDDGDAAQGAAVKPSFTEADIYRRARRTLEDCIEHGTTRMRAHVALGAGVELRGFDAVEKLRADFARAIDIELCVFPQGGLTNNPRSDELLVAALERGATVIGAAPDADADKAGQIQRVFELARVYDVDIDMSLESGEGAEELDIHLVCELTRQYGLGGRVTVGHGGSFSALPAPDFQALARRIADAGVAVTVSPATGLFMTGRVADANALVENGVNCSIASGHILDPYTPDGDGNLIRMANLQADTCHIGDTGGLRQCFYMITERAAMLMNLRDYGIAIGNPADLVIMDATTPEQAVAEKRGPLAVFRRGEQAVTLARADLHEP